MSPISSIDTKPGVVIIGYGGHGYVAADIILSMGWNLLGYCDNKEKESNPFDLDFLGTEDVFLAQKEKFGWNPKTEGVFISIGDNKLRKKLFDVFCSKNSPIINAIHPGSIVSGSVKLGNGVMVAAGAVINPLARIGDGVICNTQCSIDHECQIDNFVHIAPGAVLCGNVSVGEGSFIGANSVIKQGVRIGKNVIVGAGCVVISDVTDDKTVVGNPNKEINRFKK